MKLSKKIIIAVAVLMILPLGISQSNASAQSEDQKQIIYFHGNGCPHCAKVDAWFEKNDIWDKYPVEDREIYFTPENATYFNEKLAELGIPVGDRGVPALVIGNKVVIGDQSIISGFYDDVNAYLGRSNEEIIQENVTPIEDEESLSVWVVVFASLVDAINPCAFAVLIILLSTVVNKKSRKKALFSGLSFTLAIFISYISMGLGLYQAINATSITNAITTFVGVLAIILGLLNLKDFFWYGKGIKIEVPDSWRPRMKAYIKSITSPGGAFLIGFLISLFLLPCTSGPYIVIIGLLAKNPLDVGAVSYLVLYNLVFVLPMLVITLAAYKGSSIEKIEYYRQTNLERLHLVAGLILIGLGLFVLL